MWALIDPATSHNVGVGSQNILFEYYYFKNNYSAFASKATGEIWLSLLLKNLQYISVHLMLRVLLLLLLLLCQVSISSQWPVETPNASYSHSPQTVGPHATYWLPTATCQLPPASFNLPNSTCQLPPTNCQKKILHKFFCQTFFITRIFCCQKCFLP